MIDKEPYSMQDSIKAHIQRYNDAQKMIMPDSNKKPKRGVYGFRQIINEVVEQNNLEKESERARPTSALYGAKGTSDAFYYDSNRELYINGKFIQSRGNSNTFEDMIDFGTEMLGEINQLKYEFKTKKFEDYEKFADRHETFMETIGEWMELRSNYLKEQERVGSNYVYDFEKKLNKLTKHIKKEYKMDEIVIMVEFGLILP